MVQSVCCELNGAISFVPGIKKEESGKTEQEAGGHVASRQPTAWSFAKLDYDMAILIIFMLLAVITALALISGYIWILVKARPGLRLTVMTILLMGSFYAGSAAIVMRETFLNQYNCVQNLRNMQPYYNSFIENNGIASVTLQNIRSRYDKDQHDETEDKPRWVCPSSECDYVLASNPTHLELKQRDFPMVWCPYPHPQMNDLFGRQKQFLGRSVLTYNGSMFIEENAFLAQLRHYGVNQDGSRISEINQKTEGEHMPPVQPRSGAH